MDVDPERCLRVAISVKNSVILHASTFGQVYRHMLICVGSAGDIFNPDKTDKWEIRNT